MYLKRNCKNVNGEDYEYWLLVESVRTAKGPRQRVVANLGKLPGLDKEEKIGWEHIGQILNGKKNLQGSFFEEEPKCPEWATVNLKEITVERIRQFGDIYLGLLLWKKVKLDELFDNLEGNTRAEVAWSHMYCISTIARFCNPSSELAISESWYEKTALEDFMGISTTKVNGTRLYRTLDHILENKDDVCRHLHKQYKDLFGTDFEFLIYDVTSTYFEGRCANNKQAKHGYSRDHRRDCLQVCIGLVVTIEGLPIGYEVFDGNRNDVTTLEDMVDIMENNYGKANRIWVFDRGIVSEDNLDYIREHKAQYIVGSTQNMLKKFETELLEKTWHEVEPGVEVKIAKHRDYGEELFILCKSQGRKKRDKDIINSQIKKLEKELDKIQRSIKRGKLKDKSKAERRIGRWLGRYPRAERLFKVNIVEEDNNMVDLKIKRCNENMEWLEKTCGNYLLRTNIKEEDPKKLWKMYVQLSHAERAFRMSKGDLGLRPIYHQKEKRVQAHIFICFLALVMLKSLELWMELKGLGRSTRKLINEFKEIRSLDILIPVRNKGTVRLRSVSKPEKHVQVLLQRLGIQIPNLAKVIEM